MKRASVIAIASMVIFGSAGLSAAQTTQPSGDPPAERLRDMNLTDAQEAAIADIREDFEPKVDEAISKLQEVIDQERAAAMAVLTPEQQTKLAGMKDKRKAWRAQTRAERMAHLRDLDLTEDEMAKIDAIRKEYRPKIMKELESAKAALTPEQVKMREDALKAGKPRRDVLASLNLTPEQKTKWDAAGAEVRKLVKEEVGKIRDVLDPEQREELASMKEDRRERLQARMQFAAANLKDLDLTDQQRSKLNAIRSEYNSKVEDAGNDLRAVIREELRAIIDVLKT